MRSIRLLLIASLSASAALACVISESVESISDSVSSPFDWSSSISSSEDDVAYRQDVSELALAFAMQGGDVDAFRGGLRNLAEARGIASWEHDALTCASIGDGVRRAHVGGASAQQLGEDLFGSNALALGAYRAGYDATP